MTKSYIFNCKLYKCSESRKFLYLSDYFYLEENCKLNLIKLDQTKSLHFFPFFIFDIAPESIDCTLFFLCQISL